MTRTRLITSIIAGVALLGLAAALYAAETTADAVTDHVEALTAPDMLGRGNRTAGLALARDYIVEEMKRAGLEPAGDNGFLQGVEVVVDAEPSRNVELRLGEAVLAQGHQFEVAGFSGDGAFDGAVVFAGFGISAPQQGWDDYAGLDVRGDVVLVLTGGPPPGELDLDTRANEYLDTPQAKAAVALAEGAQAVIIVNDPDHYGDSTSQRPDVLPEFWPAPELDGISVAFATARAAESVLGPEFATRRDALRSTPSKARGSMDMTAAGDLTLERDQRTLHNVVGRLPGPADTGAPLVVGAHYDGLGLGEPGSLTDPDEAVEQLHPGADDNASGVAVLLEAAETLANTPLQADRPVIFTAMVSEELGMRGSRVLAGALRRNGEPGVMLNMDMVGRLEDGVLYAAVGEGATGLSGAIEASAASHGLQLRLEGLEERRSDHVSFAEAGFDAASLTTGRHVDYHMPTDAPDQLRPEGMATVHDFLVEVIRSLVAQ